MSNNFRLSLEEYKIVDLAWMNLNLFNRFLGSGYICGDDYEDYLGGYYDVESEDDDIMSFYAMVRDAEKQKQLKMIQDAIDL